MSDKVKAEVLTNHTFVRKGDAVVRAEKGSVIEITREQLAVTPASQLRVVGDTPKSKAKPKAEAEAPAEAPKETAPSRTPREESAPVMPSASSAPAKG